MVSTENIVKTNVEMEDMSPTNMPSEKKAKALCRKKIIHSD